jgi:hypothetical protein
MMGIKKFSSWNIRQQDNEEQVEPYRRYFFICEGANTERWYFEKLIERRKDLGIHPLIDLCLLEKTEEDKNITYPMQLIDFAEKQKSAPEISFDKERDKMIVVFDADIFERKVEDYDNVVQYGEEKKNILGVTNPSFELFLLLHYDEAWKELIEPNMEKILKNEKRGNNREIYCILREKSEINCKKNFKIGELASNLDIAIKQEKNINQDVHACIGQLTSNIGKIIESIQQDNLEKVSALKV